MLLVDVVTASARYLSSTPCTPAVPTGPRAALGMTWEGVPSIRVALADCPGIGGGGGVAGAGQGGSEPSARTATILKHPAQARKGAQQRAFDLLLVVYASSVARTKLLLESWHLIIFSSEAVLSPHKRHRTTVGP